MTAYRTVDVDGVEVFYREAGDPGAPTLLVLHGFPTSSTQDHLELVVRARDSRSDGANAVERPVPFPVER